MWKKAADALLVDDLATADAEKSAVETVQRQIRKEREKTGEHWTPKYFKKDESLDAYFPVDSLVFPQDQ